MPVLLKRLSAFLVPAVVALSLQSGAAAAAPANFIIDVDSSSAAPEIAGACTLKSALRAAAFRVPSGNCPVPSPSDLPVVRLPASATIELDNVDNVRVDGSFGASGWVLGSGNLAGLVIEGRGATVRRGFVGCDTSTTPPRDVDFGFLLANAGSTAVEIRDLTLENFCNVQTASSTTGGAVAIPNASRVTLERVRFVGNFARGAGGGARISAGRIEVRDSVFDRNSIANASNAPGLALFASETAVAEGAPAGIVLARNTFTGNTPGAAFTGASATVRLVARTRADADFNTYSGNSGDLGGLEIVPASGVTVPPTATVRQNTFNGSVTGGGLRLGSGVEVQLLNNLLLSPPGGAACTGLGMPQLFGANLSNDPSCVAAGWTSISGANVVSPTLTNSGGLVPTLRLLPGSPAIDASTLCALPGQPAAAQDVRGVPRPQDGNSSGTGECDAGATEYVRNVAPVLSTPTSASTATGTPLSFTLGAGNALRVDDADARDLPVDVELSVGTGSIRFGGEAGLTCSLGGGIGGAIRRCRGTLAALNAGLEGARYDPPVGYSGTVQLTVRASDLGNGGDDGNPLGDQRNVQITVQNQTPLLTVSPSPVNFGSVVVGNGRVIDVTLANSGNLPLQLTSLGLVGHPSISIDGDGCPRAPAALAPGATCIVQVQFVPTSAGSIQVSLVIQSNAPSSPDLALLSGTGLANVVFSAGFEP